MPPGNSDILMTLRHGPGPAERGLEQRDDWPAWRFSGDDPIHVEQALAQATVAGT